MCASEVSNEFAFRGTEITFTIEVIITIFFDTNTVNRANIIGIEDSMCGLFNAPQMLAETA